MTTPDKPKRYGPISASVQIHRMLGDLHWVGLICSHGQKDGKSTWLTTIYASPDDEDAPAYAAHFYGRETNIRRAGLLGLNTPVDGMPGEVEDLRVVTDPNPNMIGLVPMLCRVCGYKPAVETQDVIDVAAL